MDLEIEKNNNIINNLKGIHIELTNVCTLKCPKCSRTDFISQFPEKWKNHSINFDDLKKFIDIDLTNIRISLCGDYGDPIYYSKIFDACKWFKSKNANVKIVTNGSYKTKEWWENLASILNDKDEICWSIDGIPENFTQYRINADWKSIKDGIEVITKTKIKTTWKYIVFKYNQNNIDTARNLANELGFSSFVIMKSDRWSGEHDALKPDDKFVSNNTKNKFMWKKNKEEVLLQPECLILHNHHYITADGFYTPCCYMADYRWYYKTIWWKNKSNYCIKSNTLSQILNSKEVNHYFCNLKKNIGEDVCSFSCSKINLENVS